MEWRGQEKDRTIELKVMRVLLDELPDTFQKLVQGADKTKDNAKRVRFQRT